MAASRMEPDIPDGSIVVIKKRSEIADGISGAFFLNGEVSEEKLLHKDGKVFLCSENDEYQPIEVHGGDTLIVYGRIVKVLYNTHEPPARPSQANPLIGWPDRFLIAKVKIDLKIDLRIRIICHKANHVKSNLLYKKV